MFRRIIEITKKKLFTSTTSIDTYCVRNTKKPNKKYLNKKQLEIVKNVYIKNKKH